MPRLTLQDLSVKYFYGARALENLTISCEDGEKIAFLSGEEGGKTTILKCIAGLVPAESGRILIDDREITNLKTKDRDVCLMLDDGGVMKWHSLHFHLSYPLKIRKVPKEERNKRIDEVAKIFNLQPEYHDLGRMLYAEDVIKMSMARAMLRNAPVTLIDDIFSIADKGTRNRIFKDMLPHIQKMGGAVLFSTTERDEAFSVGDRIVVLNFGQVHQVGTAKELIENPKTLFVERRINPLRAIFECEVKMQDNRALVEICTLNCQVSLPDVYIGKKVFVTADLIQGGQSKTTGIVGYYYENGSGYYVTEEGYYIKADSEQRHIAEATFTPTNLRVFDYSTEIALEQLTKLV